MANDRSDEVEAEARAAFRRAFMEAYAALPLKDIGVAQLCSDAGYSRSSFYRYYGSTRDLLVECELAALPLRELEQILREVDTVDPVCAGQRIARFYDAHADVCKLFIRRTDNDYCNRFYDAMLPVVEGFARRSLELSPDKIPSMSDYLTKSRVVLLASWARGTDGETLNELFADMVVNVENNFWRTIE